MFYKSLKDQDSTHDWPQTAEKNILAAHKHALSEDKQQDRTCVMEKAKHINIYYDPDTNP